MGKIYQALEKSNTANPETAQQRNISPAEEDTAPEDHGFRPAGEKAAPVNHGTPAGRENAALKKQTGRSRDKKQGQENTPDRPAHAASLKFFDDPDLVIPDTIHKSLVTVFTPHSIESEQFRMLKNNILFPE